MATLRKSGKLIEQDEPQEQHDPDINVQAAAPVQPTAPAGDPATDMLVTLGTVMAKPERQDDAAVEKATAELRPQRDLATKVMADLQPAVQKHAPFISRLRSLGFYPEGEGYQKLRRMGGNYDKIAALERNVTMLLRLDTAAPARAVWEIDNINAEDLKSRPGLNYWRNLVQFVEHLPETYEAYVAQIKSDLSRVFDSIKASGKEGLAETWEIERPDPNAPMKPQIGFDVFSIEGVDYPRGEANPRETA